MKNKKHPFDVIKKMLNDSSINNIKNVAVFKIGGQYELFGEYTITKIKDRFRVTKDRTNFTETFHNLKNAVVWATLNKRNLINDARRVQNLDASLEGHNFNLEVSTALYKKSKDIEGMCIHLAKLSESKAKVNQITQELEAYVINVKNWQNRMYKEFSNK
jgi:hypothetical protein